MYNKTLDFCGNHSCDQDASANDWSVLEPGATTVQTSVIVRSSSLSLLKLSVVSLWRDPPSDELDGLKLVKGSVATRRAQLANRLTKEHCCSKVPFDAIMALQRDSCTASSRRERWYCTSRDDAVGPLQADPSTLGLRTMFEM